MRKGRGGAYLLTRLPAHSWSSPPSTVFFQIWLAGEPLESWLMPMMASFVMIDKVSADWVALLSLDSREALYWTYHVGYVVSENEGTLDKGPH